MAENEDQTQEERAALFDLLVNLPPMQSKKCAALKDWATPSGGGKKLEFPPLWLHCSGTFCDGDRIFSTSDELTFGPHQNRSKEYFVKYTCNNCRFETKVYALIVKIEDDTRALVTKIGEQPAFGPPVPTRLIGLVGPERELFLKGRRAENQGMGIGAFSYYRRVVESLWQRFISEVGRVSEQLGAKPAMKEVLAKAAKESRFKDAVDLIKEAIPDELRINGQNPLRLLYASLSAGLHGETDEECLKYASAIRSVLTELAEKTERAYRDNKELTDAVKLLGSRIEAQNKKPE